MQTTQLERSEEVRLIDATLGGDRLAFSALIRANDTSVRAVIYAMTQDLHIVDDILQETYVKAYRQLATFKRDARFSTWLHRIAVNTALDELRKKKPFADSSELDSAIAAGNTQDEVSCRMDILNALARLSERQRAVVVLVDGHGFGYADAGRMIGIPAGTVGFLLHQARKGLRTHLGDGDRHET